MLLISTEPVPAGGEIRVDYEGGGSKYWLSGQAPPVESNWRELRLLPPPPSGAEAMPGSREHIPSPGSLVITPMAGEAAGEAEAWARARHSSHV